jgi:8-oxo-dGTP pyrophosphatase MutT (NUDIX family)
MPKIRPIALCVFRQDDRMLVFEGYDPVKQQTFYRPLGGGIEFGETSEEAVRREIKEELGSEIAELRLLDTLDNIFVFNGKPGHEIVRIYEGHLKDRALYARAELSVTEANGETIKVVWKRLAEFNSQTPLYPDGLLELLK